MFVGSRPASRGATASRPAGVCTHHFCRPISVGGSLCQSQITHSLSRRACGAGFLHSLGDLISDRRHVPHPYAALHRLADVFGFRRRRQCALFHLSYPVPAFLPGALRSSCLIFRTLYLIFTPHCASITRSPAHAITRYLASSTPAHVPPQPPIYDLSETV